MSVASPSFENLAEFLQEFGHYPPQRIRLRPAPGTATEDDLIEAERRTRRLCELVDGVLVEKPMGVHESWVAGKLIRFVGNYADAHDLGEVLPPDGPIRFAPTQVRLPDVSFFSRARLPGGRFPAGPITDVVPDFVIEVLSEGNTRREMERKLREYFFAGVRLVWYVDPELRVVDVYTAPDQSRRLGEADILGGGDLLPGFQLPIAQIMPRVTS
jgi:Uma2 family endonuclease